MTPFSQQFEDEKRKKASAKQCVGVMAVRNPEKHKKRTHAESKRFGFFLEGGGFKRTDLKANADHVRGGRGRHDAVSASPLRSAAGPPFISVLRPLLRGCVSGKSIRREALG